MLKHILLWEFADEAEGADKATNVELVAAKLRELPAQIPDIIDFEVITPQPGLRTTADLALYSTFADEAALQRYMEHPAHVALAEFLGARRIGRQVVDYDTERL